MKNLIFPLNRKESLWSYLREALPPAQQTNLKHVQLKIHPWIGTWDLHLTLATPVLSLRRASY